MKHLCAFNYRFVPAVRLARELIDSGELGEIRHFRGRYLQDWGDTDAEVWRFDNQSEMDHPFHLHGMFFRVLDVNGEVPEHVGWKDTVNIPQMSQLRFAVQYGDPGVWMYHCHILEHQERGMMAELKVEPRGGEGERSGGDQAESLHSH